MNISLNTTRFLEECAGKWGEQQKGEEMDGNGHLGTMSIDHLR